MKVTTTQPVMIDGEHIEPGKVLNLSENDAMSLVSAGRGTINPEKSAEAVKAAKAAETAK